MVTYYAVNAGGNMNTAATWSTISAKDASRVGGAVVPSSTSDCIVDDYSGNLTTSATFNCLTLDFAINGNFAGTLTPSQAINIYGNKLTLSSTMTLVSGNGNFAFRAAATFTTNGNNIIPFKIFLSAVGLVTLTEDIYIYQDLYLFGTAVGFTGNFNIYCTDLITATSASQTFKIPNGKTLYVSGAILLSEGWNSLGVANTLTISSNTATSGASLSFSGDYANHFIGRVAFTDITASNKTLYDYQGTLTRTSNIVSLTTPPTAATTTAIGLIG